MTSLALWLQATRPKTLIASLSPIAIGTAMALTEGYFHLLTFCFILLTGLGIQISTNFANDWLDGVKGADRPTRKGPTRLVQSGKATAKEVKRATFITLAITALLGLYLIWQGGLVIALLIALALLLTLGYTAGPFPLAYLGLGDIVVLIVFGPLATVCTYYLLSHQFSWEALLAGFGPGLLSCAILTVNNLRDVDEDKISKKKTVVVRFGILYGKRQYVLCLIFASFIPLFFATKHPFVLLTLLVLLPALSLSREVIKNRDLIYYNTLLGKTGQLLALYTFLFACSWML